MHCFPSVVMQARNRNMDINKNIQGMYVSFIIICQPLNIKLVQEFLPVYLQAGFIVLVWQASPNCGTYMPVDVRLRHPTKRICI